MHHAELVGAGTQIERFQPADGGYDVSSENRRMALESALGFYVGLRFIFLCPRQPHPDNRLNCGRARGGVRCWHNFRCLVVPSFSATGPTHCLGRGIHAYARLHSTHSVYVDAPQLRGPRVGAKA